MVLAVQVCRSVRYHPYLCFISIRTFRKEVRERQILEKEANAHYRVVDAEYRSVIKDAKSELGVWTEAGVEESRQMFWESYTRGKLFAQRRTWYNMLEALFFGDERNADALYRSPRHSSLQDETDVTGLFSLLGSPS